MKLDGLIIAVIFRVSAKQLITLPTVIACRKINGISSFRQIDDLTVSRFYQESDIVVDSLSDNDKHIFVGWSEYFDSII